MRSEAWRPAAAACNRWPREAREAARQALRPGCEELAVTDPAQMPVREARPRVKNRHGGAPRGERPASWDARRLASAWPAASCAGPTGVPPSTRTFLGAPPTPRFGVSEAKSQNPGRKNAPRERGGVCVLENVRPGMEDSESAEKQENTGIGPTSACPGCLYGSFAARDVRPHPEERGCRRRSANAKPRTRVSKDEDGRALMLRDASRRVWAAEAPALASRRDAPQHEGRRATLLSMRAARSTNLWLCEMAAGSSSLFPACSLQGMMQLQRVGPPRPMWHHPRNPICHQSSS